MEQIKARIWALRFDRDQLVSSATHYERAGMKKSANANRNAAQTLEFSIRELQKEHGICPKCGDQCGYWNLPLVCGK